MKFDIYQIPQIKQAITSGTINKLVLYGEDAIIDFIISRVSRLFDMANVLSGSQTNADELVYEMQSGLLSSICYIVHIKTISQLQQILATEIKQNFCIFVVKENISQMFKHYKDDSVGYVVCFAKDYSIQKFIDILLDAYSKQLKCNVSLTQSDTYYLLQACGIHNLDLICKEIEKIAYYIASYAETNKLYNSQTGLSRNRSHDNLLNKTSMRHIISKSHAEKPDTLFFMWLNNQTSAYFRHLTSGIEPMYILRTFARYLNQMVTLLEIKQTKKSINIAEEIKKLRIFFAYAKDFDLALNTHSYQDLIALLEVVTKFELEFKQKNDRDILIRIMVNRYYMQIYPNSCSFISGSIGRL